MSKLHIRKRPLPYVASLPERPTTDVRLVVVHCTELPDLQTARSYGERIVHPSGTGNSGHYYVDRDGSVEAYVPGTRSANHVVGHNADSIGIELVNLGRFPQWWDSRHQAMTEPYPAAQIAALRQLLLELRAQFPQLRDIAGHAELDMRLVPATDDASRSVRRKLDPGPMFPWHEVLDDCGLVRLPAA